MFTKVIVRMTPLQVSDAIFVALMQQKASAEEDLKKMLEANPSGCYAVCSVVV